VKFAHCLRGERFPVDEKQDASNQLRLEQAINLRNCNVGFPVPVAIATIMSCLRLVIAASTATMQSR
jgi:hypothetical protein